MDIKQILNTAVGGYSLSKILSALVTLLVCLIAVRLIMKVVTRLLSRMQKINERLQKIIHTSYKSPSLCADSHHHSGSAGLSTPPP